MHEVVRSNRHSKLHLSLAGRGLPERMRSTAFAFLGLTAAAALGLVAVFAQLGFPLVSPGPLPNDPSRHNAVANAVALEEGVDAAVPAPPRGEAGSQADSGRAGYEDGADRGWASDQVEQGTAGAVPVASPDPAPSPSPSEDGGSPESTATPAPSPTPPSTAVAEPAPAPAQPPVAAPVPVDTAAPEVKPAKSKPASSKPDKPEKPDKPTKPDRPEKEPKPETEAPEYATDAAPPSPAPVEMDRGNGKGKARGHEK